MTGRPCFAAPTCLRRGVLHGDLSAQNVLLCSVPKRPDGGSAVEGEYGGRDWTIKVGEAWCLGERPYSVGTSRTH